MESKNAYQEKLEAQLRLWNAKLDAWQARADIAKADAKLEMQRQVEALRAKQEIVLQRLVALKGTGDGAWEELKVGVGRAWEDFKEAFDKAASKFK